MKTILLLLLILTVGFGQSPDFAREVPLDEEFTLKIGERVRVEGTRLKISFRSVPEDSRCPVDVTCIWQGNAKVKLRLKPSSRESITVILNTGLQPREIELSGLKVRLVKLSPDRLSGVEIDPEEYEATLIVSRQ